MVIMVMVMVLLMVSIMVIMTKMLLLLLVIVMSSNFSLRRYCLKIMKYSNHTRTFLFQH